MRNKSLTKLFASVLLVSFLGGRSLNAQSDIQSNTSIIYSSMDVSGQDSIQPALTFRTTETDAVYGDILDYVQNYTPGLHALIITARDLVGSDTSYTTHNWSDAVFSCTPSNQSPLKPEAYNIINSAQNRLSEILNDCVRGGFMKEGEFDNVLKSNFSEYSQVVYSGVVGALGESESCGSLYAHIPLVETNASIIILSPELNPSSYWAKGFTGLSSEYLKDTPGTPRDWTFFVVSHEFSHGYYAHGETDTHTCDTINIPLVERSWKHEGLADVGGSVVFYDAQRDSLVSQVDIPRVAAHLRGIGTFFLSKNSYHAVHTEDVNDHVSTLIFDPQKVNFESGINIDSLPYISEIPLIINTYADALAGFMFARDMNKKRKAGIVEVAEQDIAAYETVPDTVSNIWSSIELVTAFGVHSRTVDNAPEYFYAAMMYMSEAGILNDLRQQLAERYYIVFDDLLNDFFAGCHAYGSDKLRDEALINKYKECFGKSFDMTPLTKVFFPEKDKTVLPTLEKN